MTSKKCKLLLRAGVVLVLGLVVLIAAAPFWFPWVLRPAARRVGLTYAQYEREGYGRFRLTDVACLTKAGHFQAQQVDGMIPTIWAWHVLEYSTSHSLLSIRSWQFAHQPVSNQVASSSTYTNAAKLGNDLRMLKKWVPRVTLMDGTVRLGGEVIGVPQADWSNGVLSANILLPRNRSFTARVVYSRAAPLRVALNSVPLDLRASIRFVENNSQLRVEGTAYWMTNAIALRAVFPSHGNLPQTASIRADAFNIPASLLKLEHYRNVAGSLNARWSTNRFTVGLTAKAFPERAGLPPINLEARASGDTSSAQIDVARISAPWLKAELSRETKVLFKPPFLSEPTTLRVNADLGRQPWIAAYGALTGSAVLRPSRTRFPQMAFALSGSDITMSNLSAKTLRLEGDFLWPNVRFNQVTMKMTDGSDVSLGGSYNLQTKSVADGRLVFSGGFGSRFLPSGYSYEAASLKAQFSGNLGTLTNSANLTVNGFQAPHTAPLHVVAEWKGRGLDFYDARITVAATNSILSLRGSANLRKPAETLHVSSLELSRNGQAELRLQKPFAVTLREAARRSADAPRSWLLQLEPVDWSGDGRKLNLAASVDWPVRGAFRVTAQGLDSGLARDFVQGKLPAARLDQLVFSGGWTNGPLAFRLESQGEVETREGLSFTEAAQLAGGTNGISIERLSIASATQTVCRAEGLLPIVLAPGSGVRRVPGSASPNVSSGDWVQINPDGLLRLKAQTEPNSILWDKIAEATGLRLEHPRVAVSVDGTWSAPRGQITAQIERIQFPRINHPLPAVENVHLAAAVNRDEANLSKFSVRVAGQPIEMSGQIPLGKEFWRGLAEKRSSLNWRDATAHLEIENAHLASFEKVLPKILTPEGTLHADIRLQHEALSGTLVVDGARTRPLEDLGPIRDIHVAADFAGQTMLFTNVSANIGGQTVAASGQVELNEHNWRRRGLPPFQIRLRGTNVPIVRKPSVILRANLDLAVTNDPPEAPIVSGTVTLRNGLFLADLHSLIPEETASVKSRPPYFSVEAMPWADWRLKLAVQGDNFLRVQTPLFTGTVTAAMRLQGALKAPLALGETKISSGAVTFPFGSLDVKQGFVTLTSANPYHPQLYVTASAQRFGYNVNMEITGPVDAPAIQFSSTPPLSSEQIILMLTTGALPSGIGVTTSAQQRAQGLALFVGRNLLSEFGLGLGGQNRLTVQSGEYISESGRPTYNIQYRITDNWSVIGQYDRFDQFDLNLKWRVYSK